jgi:RNA polymerase sigma-70 factor (ECF subfamily)
MIDPTPEILRQERERVVRLSYAITGTRSDAEEVAQEAFARAIERGPGAENAVGAWMTRVTTNLSIDRLRERKRRPYVGPWLPEPILTGTSSPEETLLTREAFGYAFLLALEALSPSQRGVLILRDVFDLSTRECADALDMSEANVKTTLHRARQVLSVADDSPARFAPDSEAIQGATMALLQALAAGDLDAAREMLHEDIVMINDGNGQYAAARKPVVGIEKVLRFLLARGGVPGAMEGTSLVELNGAIALLTQYAPANVKHPPRAVTLFSVSEDGKILGVHALVAPEKIDALFSL